MLVGIVSDTHDQVIRTRAAVQMLIDAGAETIVHCGDLTKPEILSQCAALPCYFALGNCDVCAANRLRTAAGELGAYCLGWSGEVTVADCRLGITHGHLRSHERRLLKARPDYLLSGHSHVANDWHESGVRRINPGALHRSRQYTVVLLDTAAGLTDFLTVPRS